MKIGIIKDEIGSFDDVIDPNIEKLYNDLTHDDDGAHGVLDDEIRGSLASQ